MLYSYRWLQQFLHKVPGIDELSAKLTLSGLEVESVRKVSTDISGIVTGVIQDLQPHPRADNLAVAKVSTGDTVWTTVTGAPGLVQGMQVAYAPPGAAIAGGRVLEEIEIRGERSSGMIVSEDELGIPGQSRTVIAFDQNTDPGADVKALLGLDDWILDVAVTPNRPDVLSHLGLAREISTLFRLKVIQPVFELKEQKYDAQHAPLKVSIESAADCPRYTLRLISGVKVAPSPLWLRIMLGKIEQNPINNIVDITNYVMFGVGQPLHAFDRRTLNGDTIVIRRADNEKFTALDGQERMLTSQTLVIADRRTPVAIAGVIGGRDSGITGTTGDVVLESAVFSPPVVRRTERGLGIQTEAAYRFERGVDPLLPKMASDYASSLISRMTGAAVFKLVDAWAARPRKRTIVASTDTLQTIVGFPLNIKRVQSLLESAHCTVRRTRPRTVAVEPPSFRLDILQAADLAEEIARLTGYDRIPSVLPQRRSSSVALPREYLLTELVRDALLSAGFDEVINYSFSSEDDQALSGGEAVRLSNPLNEQTVLMRTSLIPVLLKNARYNIFRQTEDQRLFEIGKVYLRSGDRYEEHVHIAGLLTGRRFPFGWAYPKDLVDIFDVIGAVDGIAGRLKIRGGITAQSGSHPLLADSSAAVLACGDAACGFAGEVADSVLRKYDIKQKVFVFDITAGPVFREASLAGTYAGVPKYPFIARDLTVVQPHSVLSRDITGTVLGLRIPLLSEVFPFDLYVDKNNRSEHSITYRFIFRSEDRTLTDEEVDGIMKVIRDTITARYRITLKV